MVWYGLGALESRICALLMWVEVVCREKELLAWVSGCSVVQNGETSLIQVVLSI